MINEVLNKVLYYSIIFSIVVIAKNILGDLRLIIGMKVFMKSTLYT